MTSLQSAQAIISELSNNPKIDFKTFQIKHTCNWFYRCISWLWPSKNIPLNIHSTVYGIQQLIKQYPELIQQPQTAKNLFQVLDNLEIFISKSFSDYVFNSKVMDPHAIEYQKQYTDSKTFQIVLLLSLESYLLTKTNVASTKMSSRLNSSNINYYFERAYLQQNSVLAQACLDFQRNLGIVEYNSWQNTLLSDKGQSIKVFNMAFLMKDNLLIKKVMNSLSMDNLIKMIKSLPPKVDLSTIYNQKELSDITLIINQESTTYQKIFLHKAILMARSSYFNAMFTHSFKETASKEIIIDEDQAESFEEIIIYIYSQSVKHMANENLPEIQKLAEKYCFKDLLLDLNKKIED